MLRDSQQPPQAADTKGPAALPAAPTAMRNGHPGQPREVKALQVLISQEKLLKKQFECLVFEKRE